MTGRTWNRRPRDLLRETAFIMCSAVLAPVSAPAFGGVITTQASWHCVLLLNVPLGIFALVVV